MALAAVCTTAAGADGSGTRSMPMTLTRRGDRCIALALLLLAAVVL
jgi:hypothetical protein